MSDQAPVPGFLRFGLRFSKSQIRTLRNIRQHAESLGSVGVDLSLYDKAIESTEQGEPLVVLCADADEAKAMAAGFVRLGVKEPAVEDLNFNTSA